jgi:O-Antigen ligase
MQTTGNYGVYRSRLQIAERRLRSPTSRAASAPRIALMTVLVAAAMPVRIFQSVPVVNSASVLDVLLIVVGATLFLDLAFRPVETGYSALFWLLCLPLVLTTVSLAWSDDRNATVRAALVYAEGLVAYLFVLRELAGLSSARIITYIKRYAYLLIVPGLLLLLHVPGFAPAEPGLDHSSGDYLAFYSRLSHPIIGRSNNLATLLAFFAPILLYWGHTRHDRRFTRAGLITAVAVCATLSRGVLLAFVIAGLLYAPFVDRRHRDAGKGLSMKVAATVALGAFAIGVFYIVNAPTNDFFKDRLSIENVEQRGELYSYAFNEIATNPLLGRGSGVASVVPLTKPSTNAATLDVYNAAPPTNPTEPQPRVDVHNTYIQQAIYYGLPLGLLISLALCGIAGVFLARRRMTALAGVIAYALMVELVSFLFESSFEGTVLRVLLYMSVGLATALLRAVERESATA